MDTRKVPRVVRRRFKRAMRKWRGARSERTRRKALRAVKGYLYHYLYHGVLMLSGSEP